MKIDVTKWKEFKIGSIFKIYNGKGITKEELENNPGNLIVVQSGEENNGVFGKIDLDYCREMEYTFTEKSCLTVARTGSAGFVSFQIQGCVVGDSAKILLLDEKVATTNIYLFLATILGANKFKYAYGRKVTENKYLNDIIQLPIKYDLDGKPLLDKTYKYSEEGYIPDWEFMEEFINTLHNKPLTTKIKSNIDLDLTTNNWKEFCIPSLFKVEAGKYYNSDEYTEGDTPYISAADTNNGIGMLIDLPPDFTGNKITIGKIGAKAYYHPYDFCATSDVNILTPKFNMNIFIGLFIVMVINYSENYKWSYGRQCRIGDTEKIIIKLPIKYNSDKSIYFDKTYKYSKEGYVPDWEFMEKFIRALPYGDRL